MGLLSLKNKFHSKSGFDQTNSSSNKNTEHSSMPSPQQLYPPNYSDTNPPTYTPTPESTPQGDQREVPKPSSPTFPRKRIFQLSNPFASPTPAYSAPTTNKLRASTLDKQEEALENKMGVSDEQKERDAEERRRYVKEHLRNGRDKSLYKMGGF